MNKTALVTIALGVLFGRILAHFLWKKQRLERSQMLRELEMLYGRPIVKKRPGE